MTHGNLFFSTASAPLTLKEKDIMYICSICDKTPEESTSCKLRDFGYCTCKLAGSQRTHDKKPSKSEINTLTSSNQKTEKSYHGILNKRKHLRGDTTKSKPKTSYHGLQQGVYNLNHGWLTSPLTLQDFYILDNLNHHQRVILKLLYAGKTQAQIARYLKITRQAVYKHVKKFKRWNLIRENGSLNGDGSRRSNTYKLRDKVAIYRKLNDRRTSNKGCKPQNIWDDISPEKPLFSLHRLQLAYHIVNQSKPFTTKPSSFVKVYNPRGWTGYIYLYGNVRIRALPRKIIAEFVSDFSPSTSDANQAIIEAIDRLKETVKQFVLDQSAYGVELELSSPYVMNTPEFAFRSRLVKQYLNHLKQTRITSTLGSHWCDHISKESVTTSSFPNSDVKDIQGVISRVTYFNEREGKNESSFPEIYYDDSLRENGSDAVAHLETKDPDITNIVDTALKNAYQIPTLINEIRQVKAVIESGIPLQQQLYQLMGLLGHALREIAFLKEKIRNVERG